MTLTPKKSIWIVGRIGNIAILLTAVDWRIRGNISKIDPLARWPPRRKVHALQWSYKPAIMESLKQSIVTQHEAWNPAPDPVRGEFVLSQPRRLVWQILTVTCVVKQLQLSGQILRWFPVRGKWLSLIMNTEQAGSVLFHSGYTLDLHRTSVWTSTFLVIRFLLLL